MTETQLFMAWKIIDMHVTLDHTVLFQHLELISESAFTINTLEL